MEKHRPDKVRPLRTFSMLRLHDETGVSGTGVVLQGVIFPNGIVVVSWNDNGIASSLGIFNSLDDFTKIHITSHPQNGTELIWDKKEGEEDA